MGAEMNRRNGGLRDNMDGSAHLIAALDGRRNNPKTHSTEPTSYFGRSSSEAITLRANELKKNLLLIAF
jgi:hypothetical protein